MRCPVSPNHYLERLRQMPGPSPAGAGHSPLIHGLTPCWRGSQLRTVSSVESDLPQLWPSLSPPWTLQCGTSVPGSHRSLSLTLHRLQEPTHLSLTCCSGSSHVSVCGSYVCVCALTHSPWNRVLTPLFKFAHMSSWISSLVPRPGCTRSLGSSAWVCVPSLAQHHVASTVLRHFLCMLSCRYHGCPSQLLPLCLFMCVASHPV